MFNVKVTNKADLRKIAKNIRFGTAVGLTRTAQDGQDASISSIEKTFTTRTNWYKKGNKFGVKIQAAKRDNLTAAVKTSAPWLPMHETGGTKRPKNKFLAIPTTNVRRTKRQLIAPSQKPLALKSKRTFIINTSKGKILFQRKGKGRRGLLTALYAFEPKARIRKQSTFYEPVDRVVKRKIHGNIAREIQKALLTAK